MKRIILFFAIGLLVIPLSFAAGGKEKSQVSDEGLSENYYEPDEKYVYERPEEIVMIWDLIIGAEDNLRPEARIAHPGLDVISPTWFCLSGEEGDVSSLASREYVEWAHDNNILVWALFENKSDDWLTFKSLSDWGRRQRIIEQLVRFAREYNLDGINLNFEAMNRYTGKYYEFFVFELYEKLHPLGITVSVDVPVRIGDLNRIYDINLIANNSDYVVILAYDQYDRYSHEDGPTAAIAWVRQGVEEILEIVAPEKLILGIPFYSIIWREDRSSAERSSEFLGMAEAYEMFSKNPRIWGRDRDTGQIFAEIEMDHVNYRTWLEDEHSISLKLDVVNDYYLAGLSAWRRGLELPEIWDLINAYFR